MSVVRRPTQHTVDFASSLRLWWFFKTVHDIQICAKKYFFSSYKTSGWSFQCQGLPFCLIFFNMYFLSCSWHGFTNFQKSSCNSNSFFFFFFFQNFRMKSSIPRLAFFLLNFELELNRENWLPSKYLFWLNLIFFNSALKKLIFTNFWCPAIHCSCCSIIFIKIVTYNLLIIITSMYFDGSQR